MREFLYNIIALFFRFFFQKNKVTIIVYHNISSSLFEEHVRRLKSLYSIISFNDYIEFRNGKIKKLPKYSLIITFDDGYKENYELLEIFKKYSIRPTIFLCTYPLNTNRSVWSSQIENKKEFSSLLKMEFKSMCELLERKGFNSYFELQDRTFLNFEEINKMKPFVDFQSHTDTHANLAMASKEIIYQELFTSKKKLEDLGLEVHSVCYPFSYYSQSTIEIARKIGYRFGLTVEPFYNSKYTNPFRLRRISMNDAHPSLVLLKASGCYMFLKEYVFMKKSMRLFLKK